MDLKIRDNVILQNVKFILENDKTYIYHNNEIILIISNDDYWIDEICYGLFELKEVIF